MDRRQNAGRSGWRPLPGQTRDQMEHTYTERARLEHRIGRPLPANDSASIANLNDVPEALVAETRMLGHRTLASDLIFYYTTFDCWPYVRSFVKDVVFGTESPKYWRRGGVLVPATSLCDQLCLSRSALLEPIGGHAGVRIVPRLAAWAAGDSSVGAPARPRPEADYRSISPPGALDFTEPDLEPMPDVAVGVRRWIAGRLACCLKGGAPTSIEELFVISPYQLPPTDRWSQDAGIAVAALLREFREIAPEPGAIPGFRAPDEWYRDSWRTL
jgi:hypothetical protein